ncbi:hypothetical protein PRUB_b0716 [Pseudoalteromonas rubra]|uniref:Elongation factor Tu n=1 Tax=Pseudoalteromonas rubra TaxID=43658 RepID=A0A8T0C041_9GAMM|nr:GTP-binding protein [Pseudoalteromonas rubra]KAF7781483.1 hypothetical protein PRUB_b0716 [Pseudoalteromonas rubra]
MASNDEFMKQAIFIDTIGARGHGKTTLTAAITQVLAKDHMAVAQDFAALNNAPQHKARSGVTFYRSEAVYESSARVCIQYDCPNYMDHAKGINSGETRVDAAILVVSQDPDFSRACDEYLMLLRDFGVSHIIIFMNKCDLEQYDELTGLVESLVREQLNGYGFDGDNAPVIYGSALQALEGVPVWEDKIRDLIRTMDDYFIDPVLFKDQPFMMPVEDIFTLPRRDTQAYSRIETGTIRVHDPIELVGIRDTRQTSCSSIDIGAHPQERVSAGDSAAIGLKGIPRSDIERGMVLCEAGTLKSCQRFEARVYCLTSEEGGRRTPLLNDFEADFSLHYLDVAGTADWPRNIEMMMPGDELHVTVRLNKSMAIKLGTKFEIRQQGQIVGVGHVTDTFD